MKLTLILFFAQLYSALDPQTVVYKRRADSVALAEFKTCMVKAGMKASAEAVTCSGPVKLKVRMGTITLIGEAAMCAHKLCNTYTTEGELRRLEILLDDSLVSTVTLDNMTSAPVITSIPRNL